MSFLYEKDDSVALWLQILFAMLISVMGTLIGSVIAASAAVLISGVDSAEQLYATYPSIGTLILGFSYIFVSYLLILMFRRANRTTTEAMGLKISGGAVRLGLMGILLGSLLMSMIVGIAALLGFIKLSLSGFKVAILLSLALHLFAIFAEELVFRGYIQPLFGIRYDNKAAIVLQAFLATLYGWVNGSSGVVSIINTMLLAVALGIMVERSGSIYLSLGFHVAWSFTQSGMFGMRGSDSAVFSALLNEGVFTGTAATGIEGGLFATVMLAAMCLLSLLLPQHPKSTEFVRICDRFWKTATKQGGSV